MREGERSGNIYVVVDSSKIARCGWCGFTNRGGTYCSSKCALADGMPGLIPLLVITVVLSGLLQSVIYRLLSLVLMIPLLIVVVAGMEYRGLLPRNSRRVEAPLDSALLATMSTSVVCPRCDAELDLRNIGKDRVYACGYCGASGTIDIIDRSQQRGSGSGWSI